MGKINTRIPGLSFSWKKALGITQAKQKIARQTGIPTSKAGIERKIGKMILKALFGKVMEYAVYLLLVIRQNKARCSRQYRLMTA